MVRITEELLRKRSEHNECEISTLEELSLHQEDIEKIEHLHKWCRDLQILLLQSNLISKIENLWKLKKLTYLNLALNNIERIENLDKLESLEKLDLTLNFIGELTSVQNLKGNYNLKYLYLTGNPCTDYKGYREYVITVLPQLKQLDNFEVERSERIIANQDFVDYERSILLDQDKYFAKRLKEKSESTIVLSSSSSDEEDKNEEEMTEEELKAFWDSPSRNTPEDRIQIARKARKLRDVDRKRTTKKEKKKPPRLFTNDGRPLNINQARIPLTLTDDMEKGRIILDVSVYRYLDTSLINVDLHPKYVTITIKGKILQIVFEEEVKVDASTCQRSQSTGHLVLTMPKEKSVIRPKKMVEVGAREKAPENIPPPPLGAYQSKREYLEIGPPSREMDFSTIVHNGKPGKRQVAQAPIQVKVVEKMPSPDFVDDTEVPPLE